MCVGGQRNYCVCVCVCVCRGVLLSVCRTEALLALTFSFLSERFFFSMLKLL